MSNKWNGGRCNDRAASVDPFMFNATEKEYSSVLVTEVWVTLEKNKVVVIKSY